MAGAYCQYCGHRCFVYRVTPDRSWAGHMATCDRGAAHDRAALGYNHRTAINPVAIAHLIGALTAATGLSKPRAQEGVLAVLRAIAGFPLRPESLEPYVNFIQAEIAAHAHNPQ
jgi:hypothetical protein